MAGTVDNRKKARVFLSLGSNLGERKMKLQEAIEAINELERVELKASSSVYRTQAWGNDELNEFLNMVVEISTSLDPQSLLDCLKLIEQQVGRKTKTKANSNYQNRPIDIDILYYADESISTQELVLPHPRIKDRKFVLEPLNEIAPEFQDISSKKTMEQLLQECKDPNKVVRIS